DPDVFLLLPATPLVHRHPRILRTIPVDHTTSFVHVPDLHHRLLGAGFLAASIFLNISVRKKERIRSSSRC
ncbi:MAG: hypothetical protein ACLQJF_22620, partial [Candidatus Sulfotelmatobacter sp.]